MRRTADPIQALLTDVKVALRDLYQSRLAAVYLYGSYARGQQDAESDLDLLIVLDRVEHYAGEVDRTSQSIGTISLKYGVSISRVFVSEEDWRGADTGFLANAREDAIPA